MTERRIRLPGGLELEVGIAPTEWARVDPIDPGTARVARDGLRVIHDPKDLFSGLLLALGRPW
ncbi:MAG: hypothetical protein ACRDHM_03660 [Actinomycetota bacterium]